MISPQSTVLFQGDSITDTGRNRHLSEPNQQPAMGHGYAYLTMARLLARQPQHKLRVFNRGISGNRVPDLHERWQSDCLALKPDVLSILIGVNDWWHQLDGRYRASVEQYESGYRELVQRTLSALPGLTLVLCEPFVLRCGVVDQRWFPELDRRREAARRVAESAGALFVELQGVFDRAVAAGTAPDYWAADGVHPTPQGHQLISDAWLATLDARAA
jgi:lysophospholipase L1-like esterase